jgi:spore germination cell wall hydrolase CwlJ-like protein
MIEIIVAMTIAYEASNQSIDCQKWIAKVIEVRSEERNKTPKEIVMQKSQFSCWDKNGQPTQKRKLTDKELGTAILAWNGRDDIKERPTHYHDVSVTPYWSKSPKVKFLKQIGDIKFYREN